MNSSKSLTIMNPKGNLRTMKASRNIKIMNPSSNIRIMNPSSKSASTSSGITFPNTGKSIVLVSINRFSCHHCTYCETKFRTMSALSNHMKKTHAVVKMLVCRICGVECPSKTSLQSHFQEHPGETPFSCSVCAENFTDFDALSEHLKVHDVNLPVECSVCKKKFFKKRTLRQHVIAHSMVAPCTICEKKFCRANDLKKHMAKHGATHQTSPSCKNKFKDPRLFKPCSEVNIVECVKTGIRICTLCKQEFVDHNMTKTHNCVQTVSGTANVFGCNFCSRKFSQRSHLKTHLRLHKEVKTVCV